MNGFVKTFSNLSTVKKILLISAVSLTFALTFLTAQIAQRPNMVLLYAGLEGRAAGEVIGQLEQLGVPMQVRGSAIYVDEKDRDRMRMMLASSGLPSGGQQGYELLDGLSGFGTTAEMFDAAYWRAKEGELARTLLATPGISQARVHIGAPRRRSFSKARAVPTASVTLTGTSSAVSRSSATAARYMVALAIPGLAAEQVAVIDANNGVILRPGDEGMTGGATSDSDKAQKMKAEIEAMLAARVGDGRARVSVNIETTTETESISRRVIDPESKTLRETKSIEMSEKGNDTGGAVTVASNLPDGEAGGGSERSSQRDENRTTDVYDYTETREEVLRPAGTIKKISVAVLLDEIRTTDDDGVVTSQARTPEELAKLENLVKSAVGFSEERGDVVTVESISYADLPQEGSIATAADQPSFLETNMMQLVQLGVLVLVILILGLFVVRPVLAAGQRQQPLIGNDDPALSAIDVTPREAAEAEAAAASSARGVAGAGAAVAGAAAGAAVAGAEEGAASAKEPPSALELLREAVSNRSDESVDVLKNWLDADTVAEHVQ